MPSSRTPQQRKANRRLGLALAALALVFLLVFVIKTIGWH